MSDLVLDEHGDPIPGQIKGVEFDSGGDGQLMTSVLWTGKVPLYHKCDCCEGWFVLIHRQLQIAWGT